MDFQGYALIVGGLLAALCFGTGSVIMNGARFDPATDGISPVTRLKYNATYRKSAAYAFWFTAGAWAFASLAIWAVHGVGVAVYVVIGLGAICILCGGWCLWSSWQLSQAYLNAVANEQMAKVIDLLGRR